VPRRFQLTLAGIDTVLGAAKQADVDDACRDNFGTVRSWHCVISS